MNRGFVVAEGFLGSRWGLRGWAGVGTSVLGVVTVASRVKPQGTGRMNLSAGCRLIPFFRVGALLRGNLGGRGMLRMPESERV